MRTALYATPGSEEVEDLQEILDALDHPVRRFVIEILCVDDATAGDLAASAADVWGISTTRASQHLQVLARAGLVTVTADGSSRYYRRQARAAGALATWLRQVELAG